MLFAFMRWLLRFATRFLAPSLLLCVGCQLPPVWRRGIAADSVLIFEQRVATSNASAGAAWESWQLYESGRFVYARAGSAPTQRHIDAARLQAVHGWLYAHDGELREQRTTPPSAPKEASEISAVCQVHTSHGLLLAAHGEPQYGACDELKKLAVPE